MWVYASVHAYLSTYDIQKSLKVALKGILGQGSGKGREGWRKMRERERDGPGRKRCPQPLHP